MSCKKTEWLKFNASDQEEIAFPLATIEGAKPGPTVTITAGIHGAEYPGIVSAIRLFKELTPETVAGKIQIVTISSLKAFESRSMFVCPIDGKNLNLSLIHISEPTRLGMISYAVFCLKKKNTQKDTTTSI